MRNVIIVLIISLVLGWWIYNQPRYPDAIKRPKPAPVEAIAPSAHELEPENPVKQDKFIQVEASTEGQEDSRKPGEPPAPDIVHFQIKNGWAIAGGDMLLGKVLPGSASNAQYSRPARPQKWKKANIPYYIQPDLPNPERVQQALRHIEEKTVLHFVPSTDNTSDTLVFEIGDEHCFSYLGRLGGLQPIYLSNECNWQNIVHEILHALGFPHEHSRSDRDQYVDIIWDNVLDEYKTQFDFMPEQWAQSIRQFPYDVQSIMHYPSDAFARNPSDLTIQQKSGKPIPPRLGLSEQDIIRINQVYGR